MKTGRAQCLIIRGDRILMARHNDFGIEHDILPGGGIEGEEAPEEAAVRELKEECGVDGIVISRIAEVKDPFRKERTQYTFLMDIGDQEPVLGSDPECKDADPILVGLSWKRLDEMCERDRAFLIGSGLTALPEFVKLILSWGDEMSYPEVKQ